MPLSWSEIKEKWIGKYRVGYSRRSILKSFETIETIWGLDYLEEIPTQTIWYITNLINTGLMMYELRGIDSTVKLFDRLRKKEKAAFSEARLATFFSKLGYEIRLQPQIETGRYNDLAVKHNDDWINIELKTPIESEIKQDLNRYANEILRKCNQIPESREVHICLARKPTYDELKAIINQATELASRQIQPEFGLIKEVAWIKTDHPNIEIIKDNLNWKIPLSTNIIEPAIFSNIYKNSIILLYKWVGFHGKFETFLNVYVPFEDPRLIDFLHKKKTQLSPNSFNIIAIDTTNIAFSYPRKKYLIISEEDKAKHELSRRIGAILLFRETIIEGKLHLESSLLIHPNPYKVIPSSFLEKCNLESYSDLIER